MALIIPHKELEPDTLYRIIEQFVSKDGPDSGHVETSLEEKLAQVKRQLDTGKAFLLYDPKTQSCNILSKDDAALKKMLEL